MDTQNLDAQFRLFLKYWESGAENDNLRDFQTADQLRGKIIPQVESLLDEDNKVGIASIFGDFSEFLFDYLLCLHKLGKNASNAHHNLKSMSERAINLDPNSFSGRYHLAVYHSWNLKSAHAGDLPAVYKGEDAATSIVGTAFNLLFKGATLGATATAAGISKSSFSSSVQNMIATYNWHVQQSPVAAQDFIKMTSNMFNMAEFCEGVNNRLTRDICSAIRNFNINHLDFSEVQDEYVSEVQETIMELMLLADSKL